MKPIVFLPSIATALLVLPIGQQGQEKSQEHALEVYRLSELGQRLPESERQDWSHSSPEQLLLMAKAIGRQRFNRINLWSDLDLLIVDGTDAEQEATKKVIAALRRQPVSAAQSASSEDARSNVGDVNEAIEQIKHELTRLQHLLQEHK
jgi:hypothetical protein